ncbi:hypothetical protein BGZ68_003976, partial [Mortierella alpina]
SGATPSKNADTMKKVIDHLKDAAGDDLEAPVKAGKKRKAEEEAPAKKSKKEKSDKEDKEDKKEKKEKKEKKDKKEKKSKK